MIPVVIPEAVTAYIARASVDQANAVIAACSRRITSLYEAEQYGDTRAAYLRYEGCPVCDRCDTSNDLFISMKEHDRGEHVSHCNTTLLTDIAPLF